MKRGVLIKRSKDQQTLHISIVELNNEESELTQIYRLLEVQLIDVVRYSGKTIYVDDEGLLQLEPQLTMNLINTNQYLFGNILIMGDCDENGETLGISLEEANSLIKQFKFMKNIMNGKDVILW